MSDNFYLEDLIFALREDTVPERYYRLIPLRDELLACLEKHGAVLRDDVTDDVFDDIGRTFGADISLLFGRYLHIFDISPSKLKEIPYATGTAEYAALAELMRLPGVRILRAELYCHSGVTLEVLAEKSTDEIRKMVSEYVMRENRSETVPFVKEVNCHRAAAAMILHLRESDKV